MARVLFQSINKSIAHQTIVSNLDLTVEDGHFAVLVGPSGCGKSTTLRMLAGLETPTSGRMFLDDREVTPLSPAERDVAMVFQNYALYPHMTVAENIGFPLRMRHVSKGEAERRIARAAEMLNIADVLKRKPKELSGGQRQRVALGRAIVREPKVFLLDEPLSNVDAKLRNQMRKELRTLFRDLRATVIYVTHDQLEAMTMGDEIVVMDRGQVQQAGPPHQVYRNPANTFVASFLGTPPMNLLTGALDANGCVRVEGEFVIETPAPVLDALTRERSQEVTVGIRPEDLLLDAPGTSGSAELQSEPGSHRDGPRSRQTEQTEVCAAPVRLVTSAWIDLVEDLGAETLLHLRLGSRPAAMRYNGAHAPRDGDKINVRIDPSKICYFDSPGGNRI